MKIDLRNCKKGDILICKHGVICIYDKPCEESNYYDHYVEYLFLDGKFNGEELNLGGGTRTHDGFVFRNNRKEEDYDVIAVIGIDKLLSYLK